MKMLKPTTVAVVLFVMLAARPAMAQELMARVYFAGVKEISTDPASRSFTNEFGCAEARALENQTLNKLAQTPGVWFKSRMAPGASDGAALLRPLLDDFLTSKWLLEIGDEGTGSPEYALAIRLDNNRAQLWSRNLATLLQSWTGLAISANRSGWLLKKHESPNLFQFTRSGDWVIIDCGEDVLHLQTGILNDLELNTRRMTTGANWLSADLDWPRLTRFFPAIRSLDLPRTDLKVTAADGNFLINGRLELNQPLPPLPEWRVPTDAIHMPFISFTAVRGITPWLERQSWAMPYEVSPMPDQYFVWALLQSPFQTFAAAPVANGRSALMQLDAKLPGANNAAPASPGPLSMPIRAQMANDQITFQGIPFAAPFIKLQDEKSGDFLFGGFFPNTPRSRPLPPQLFTRLATPKLVYYHWEITAARLQPLPQLAQLILLISHHRQLGGLADKWIMKIGPSLGNTVTTAVETGPEEVTFSRKAPGGLTALEFFALASWLEAPNFPGCDLRMPMRPMFRKPLPRQGPGTMPQPFQLHPVH